MSQTAASSGRHAAKVPSISLPKEYGPGSLDLPSTPPPPSSETASLFMSPKSPKAELGRTRSQSRRTLGNWQLGKTIGQGSMGRVRLGHNLSTGEQVAVKIIPRAPAENATDHPRKSEAARPKDENREIRSIREAAIVTLLRHPYICGMRDVIITQGHFYLFFEYVDGGQMLDYIISHGKLREKHARKFARQILSALDYCHRNSIVHRDLKIENILISKTGNIKIIDFGLSNLYSSRSLLTTYCGSLYFAAPELLNAKAYTGPEVDIWSFGIVLYVLVCGKVPFDDQSMAALHAKIKRGFVEYPGWLSTECKTLLSRILVVDATKRATLAEIANHPWMSKGGEGPIENYFPIRLPLTLPLDDEVIRGMRGFEFGTEDDIRQHLTTIVQSPAYVKASEQYARLMEAATSTAIEKSEKRKPFSLEFYKRRLSTSPASVSWPENGAMSTTSLQFDDPTNAFDPLLSIYSLVREKQERDRLQVEPPRVSTGLASPKSERALRIPSIPMPEAAHTGEMSYEIASPPSKYTYGSSPTRSRTRSRGDEEISDTMQGANLEATSSSRSKFLDDITGTGKTGGLLRRISHKWSKDTVKESRKEAKAPAVMSPVPHIEIATPSRTLSGAKKSRETDRYVPSSPQHLSPAKRTNGLGRSTSISEGDYRKRYASAVSDDETSSGRRPGPPSPDTPKSAISIQSSTSGRARSMGHARHATISAARRANDRQDRDFWSGPLTGPSTIPEESKEAIRDIPSRSDSSRDDQFARPVHLKGLFSVATTSTKPVQKMRSDLIRVLDQFGISHEEVKGGFFCVHRPSIDLDSIHEPPPHVEEFSSGKKARRRLSFGAPIAAFGFGGDKRLRAEGESDISSDSIADLQAPTSNRAEVSGPGGSLVVQFEIHIVKFPWLSLHGIQFKRVGGDVWQYKNACVKIVAELNW